MLTAAAITQVTPIAEAPSKVMIVPGELISPSCSRTRAYSPEFEYRTAPVLTDYFWLITKFVVGFAKFFKLMLTV